MFDDIKIQQFTSFTNYGQLIDSRVRKLFTETDEAELQQIKKIILAVIDERLPTMPMYYRTSFVYEMTRIYNVLRENKLTQGTYLALNGKLTLNGLNYTDSELKHIVQTFSRYYKYFLGISDTWLEKEDEVPLTIL